MYASIWGEEEELKFKIGVFFAFDRGLPGTIASDAKSFRTKVVEREICYKDVLLICATFVAEAGKKKSQKKSLLKCMFYHKQFIISFVNKISLFYYIIQLRVNV